MPSKINIPEKTLGFDSIPTPKKPDEAKKQRLEKALRANILRRKNAATHPKKGK